MNRQEQLDELLLRWEQLYQQGESVTAEELCGDTPQLANELEERIQALKSMGVLIDAPKYVDKFSSSPAAVSSNPQQEMSTQTRYRILRSLAKGGLGEVFVAVDELLGREVALKVIRRPYDDDPHRRQRFLKEAEITSRLEHPGIVPVYGTGRDIDGKLCYVMRLIGGENLQDAIILQQIERPAS